jgi:glyoxylase-like metal-dependent hydrolase (beta-lactamase superfamily II)
LSIGDIGYFFITHDHFDHQVTLPCEVGPLPWKGLDPDGTESLPDIRMVHLPGHDTALRGLSFCTASDEVWVVGDAILDSDWLKLWGYYWPNGYGADDIIRTWRSVALILSSANTVIPGHGPPIHVSSELLEALIAGFPQAAQAAKCLDVESALRTRLSEGS